MKDLKRRIKSLDKNIFFILSTARCRSSWFGNFFTYKDSFCYKEELRYVSNWDQLIDRIEKRPEKNVGFSDPELLHYIETLHNLFPKSKYVLLDRNVNDAKVSLAIITRAISNKEEWYRSDKLDYKFKRWLEDIKKFKKIVKDYEYIHWNDMNKCDSIKKIWNYILPDSEFDVGRWELLSSLVITETLADIPYKMNRKTCMAPFFNFDKLDLAR